MPTYISLYKWTEQGVKNVKGAPQRIQAAIKAAEGMGGKVRGIYVVMGEYDVVAVGEFPNDEAAATYNLALSSLGNVRTTSLRAFTSEEFSEMVKKLP
jgi:uncharacterized protein with GYD domain